METLWGNFSQPLNQKTFFFPEDFMGIIFYSPLFLILLKTEFYHLLFSNFTAIILASSHHLSPKLPHQPFTLLLFTVASVQLIPHKYPSNPISKINDFYKTKICIYLWSIVLMARRRNTICLIWLTMSCIFFLLFMSPVSTLTNSQHHQHPNYALLCTELLKTSRPLILFPLQAFAHAITFLYHYHYLPDSSFQHPCPLSLAHCFQETFRINQTWIRNVLCTPTAFCTYL